MNAVKRGHRIAVASALAVAALASAAPTASAVAVANACRNNVTANNSQITVDTTGTATSSVAPGGSITLSSLHQEANVPGSIFVAGYNLGLLAEGENVIPANVLTDIEGTNTTPIVQTSSTEATTITTTINDPDNSPGTGDETATDGTFEVDYDDMVFTAGPSGISSEFRQDTQSPLAASPEFSEVGSLIIRALVGGVFKVRFACTPATVTPPDPGTVTLIDPAGPFATTAPAQLCRDTSSGELNLISTPSGGAWVSDGVTTAVDSKSRVVFTGTRGADVIIGTDQQDVMNPVRGDDTVCSLAKKDVVNASDGNDWMDGGANIDELSGGNNNDTILGGTHNDVLTGGSGDDNLDGGAGADKLNGDAPAPAHGLGTADNCDGGTEIDTEVGGNCETSVNIP